MSRAKHDFDPYHLAELELFAGCTPEELDVVTSLLTPITVDAGDVIIREGTLPREAFVVGHGSLQVTATEGDAVRALAVATDGDPLGEMALLNQAPRNATVTALTSTTLYVATPREFRSLLRVPSVGDRVVQIARRRQLANAA